MDVCFMTCLQIKLLVFNIVSYNAIKSYKTEGRAEQLMPVEYLISAAEAGKAVMMSPSRLNALVGAGSLVYCLKGSLSLWPRLGL